MFKIVRAKITREQILVEDVLCNACGKSTKDHQGMNYEHAVISASWGYCSRKDCENHRAHLCEDCYDELVQTWKHPPSIDGSMGAGMDSIEAVHQPDEEPHPSDLEEAEEIDYNLSLAERYVKERHALLDMTALLECHPEGYDGPCACKTCMKR